MRSLGSALLTGVRGRGVCDGGEVVACIVGFVVTRRPALKVLSRCCLCLEVCHDPR